MVSKKIIVLNLMLIIAFGLHAMEREITGIKEPEIEQYEKSYNPKKREREYPLKGEPKIQKTEFRATLDKLESMSPKDQLTYFKELMSKGFLFNFWQSDEKGRHVSYPTEEQLHQYGDVWNFLYHILYARLRNTSGNLQSGYINIALQYPEAFGIPSYIAHLVANVAFIKRNGKAEDMNYYNGLLKIFIQHAHEYEIFDALLNILSIDISEYHSLENIIEELQILFAAGANPNARDAEGNTIADYIAKNKLPIDLTPEQQAQLLNFVTKYQQRYGGLYLPRTQTY
jgi:hypothetical protein